MQSVEIEHKRKQTLENQLFINLNINCKVEYWFFLHLLFIFIYFLPKNIFFYYAKNPPKWHNRKKQNFFFLSWNKTNVSFIFVYQIVVSQRTRLNTWNNNFWWFSGTNNNILLLREFSRVLCHIKKSKNIKKWNLTNISTQPLEPAVGVSWYH